MHKKIDLCHLRGGGGGQLCCSGYMYSLLSRMHACKHNVYTQICPCMKIIDNEACMDSTQFRQLKALRL